jgi:predicted CXXCH cytochrome family protein
VGFDDTIVNPADLSRDLAEAVCQQCHLESDATVAVRGRKAADYRPGLRGQDFRLVYVFDETGPGMTVVGHVEQMHQSKCYQRSSTFSCLTCHDPHGEPAPADREAHYNGVCLSCHRPSACKGIAVERLKASPAVDCIECHMPRAPVEVPHLAFTHHRVGIHRQPPTPPGGAARPAGELRPFLDPSGLSEPDRQRSLGEAYRLLALRDADAGRRAQYRRRALELLTAARAAGLRDGDLEASLAQLCFEMKVGDPLAHAQRALTYPDLAGQSRCDALFVVAQQQAGRGNPEEAITALREVTQLQRNAMDWLYLSRYAQAVGDQAAAREALLTAVRIDPRKWDVQRYLAEQYRREGDAERAAWHQRRAVPP